MSEGRKYVQAGQIPKIGTLQLKVPVIDPEILKDPSRLDEMVEAKLANALQVQKGITDALEWMAGVIIWLALCQDPMKKKIAKATIADEQANVRSYIDECLGSEEPIYRNVAAISYLNFVFGQEVADKDEAAELLADLEERKLLVKVTQGPIMIGYQRYQVSKEFGLDSDDIVQIQTAVGKFSRRFMEVVRQQRQEATKNLLEQADLSFQDFLDGKEGKFLLKVPAESYMHEGQEKWRGGGDLFLEVKNKEVIPLASSGSIEKMVQNMMNEDVRLQHHTLQWETPPGTAKAFDKVCEGIMKSRHIGRDQAESCLRKMQSLWHLVTRGIDAELRKGELAELKKDYTAKATITPVQFYGLNGSVIPQPGRATLELEGVFKERDESFYNVILLIERSKENDVSRLKIIEAPEHVKKLLGPTCVENTLEEGEDFLKLPPTMRRLLRSIRSKTDLNAEIAKESATN